MVSLLLYKLLAECQYEYCDYLDDLPHFPLPPNQAYVGDNYPVSKLLMCIPNCVKRRQLKCRKTRWMALYLQTWQCCLATEKDTGYDSSSDLALMVMCLSQKYNNFRNIYLKLFHQSIAI